jgi:hypothetical protein
MVLLPSGADVPITKLSSDKQPFGPHDGGDLDLLHKDQSHDWDVAQL